MTISIAYRTEDQSVKDWLNHMNEEDRAFRDRITAFKERYFSNPSDAVYTRRNNWGSYVCSIPSYATPKTPSHWRSADGGLVPRKKDGDPEMLKAFNALIYGYKEECPGMPKWCNGSSPGITLIGDVVWVTWGGAHPQPEQIGEMWVAERPSAFYAAKEAAECDDKAVNAG